jgi:hypothetical protein
MMGHIPGYSSGEVKLVLSPKFGDLADLQVWVASALEDRAKKGLWARDVRTHVVSYSTERSPQFFTEIVFQYVVQVWMSGSDLPG